jgi:hypothetical protein
MTAGIPASRDDKNIAALIRGLNDPDPSIQGNAALALADLGEVAVGTPCHVFAEGRTGYTEMGSGSSGTDT